MNPLSDYRLAEVRAHRADYLGEYGAGEMDPAAVQVLTAEGFLDAHGLTAKGRAWRADQCLRLAVTDTALFRELRPHYCADKIAGRQRRVPAPRYYAGRYWLCTGFCTGDQPEVYAAEVVRPAAFVQQYPDAPVRATGADYWGPHGYCGGLVQHGADEWIITERELTVHLAPGDTIDPPPLPAQLSLF